MAELIVALLTTAVFFFLIGIIGGICVGRRLSGPRVYKAETEDASVQLEREAHMQRQFDLSVERYESLTNKHGLNHEQAMEFLGELEPPRLSFWGR